MAEVTINNSPVHSDSMISYPYGVQDSGYSCGWHTGVDIVPYGTTENNPILYPVKSGTVVYVNNTSNVALGVQCQILDDDGFYWRYCHMILNSLLVNVGDRVTTLTPIGRMGATRKCYRKTFTFRMFYNFKLAMFNFCKPLRKIRNTK